MTPDRRAFLTGRAAGDALTDALAGDNRGDAGSPRLPPAAGATVRVAQRSMACEFAALLNPGDRSRVMHAGDALAEVHRLEGVLSGYLPESTVCRLNRDRAANDVDPDLFAVLEIGRELARLTGGAFTPIAGSLVRLWREARDGGELPSQSRASAEARFCDADEMALDPATRAVALPEGAEIDLGGIGKGYALDRAAGHLEQQEITGFLLHGGRSSVIARGDHAGLGGWPVGLGDPHRTTRRLGTVLLKNSAMATSGSNVQFFRRGGRRYGHVLDPRTGWPVDPDRPGGLLSATAFAPTAAEADALSTALYVLGLPAAAAVLDANPRFGGILVPAPARPRLDVIVRNVDPALLFLDPAAARLADAQPPEQPRPSPPPRP